MRTSRISTSVVGWTARSGSFSRSISNCHQISCTLHLSYCSLRPFCVDCVVFVLGVLDHFSLESCKSCYFVRGDLVLCPVFEHLQSCIVGYENPLPPDPGDCRTWVRCCCERFDPMSMFLVVAMFVFFFL